MLIETKTTAFQIDDRFQGRRIEFEGGSVWVPPPSPRVQPPIFNFALSEVKDIAEEFEPKAGFADDYEARVRAYFDVKRIDVGAFEDSVREVAGRPALVRTSTYEKGFPGRAPEDVFALFVNVRLDDAFCQEFSADCPLAERDTWEPAFWAAIESWQHRGGAREAIDVQEEARAEQYARIDALLAKSSALDEDDGLEDDDASASSGAGSGADAVEVPPFDPATGGVAGARVGGVGVALGEAKWGIASFTKQLVVEVAVEFDDVEAARGAEVLSAYGERLDLTLQLSGVYSGDAAPRGRFVFEDGRTNQGPNVRLECKGLEYGLSFSGAVDLADGWAVLRGVFGVSYDTTRRVPVDVRVRLEPEELDWTAYGFRTLDELRAVEPWIVRHVTLQDLEEGDDLGVLGRCTGLQTLFLRPKRWGEAAAIDVPDEVFGFGGLVHLTLSAIRLRRVPEAIGGLEELERLALVDCGVSAVPDAVWRLPKLSSLDLSRNALASVPAGIELPEVVSIDLAGNRLAGLPGALFEQPRLKRIDLGGNPLESLPESAGAGEVAIELDLADRMRLLDWTYRGADGAGTIAWDDDAYYVRSSAKLAAAVDEVIEEGEGCPAHAEGLRFLTKRGVGLRVGGEEDYALLGNHRVGGMPDLPASIPYPRFTPDGEGAEETPYEFLVQLDCEALAPLQAYLPRTGFLYFFLTTVHDVYGRAGSAARVEWFDGPRSELVSGRALHFDADDYYEMAEDAYGAQRLEASAIASPPQWYAAHQNPHLFRGPATELGSAASEEFVSEIAHEVFSEPLEARFPFDVGVGTYGFTQHEEPELRAALTAKGRPEDWMILLHLKSCGDMMWGDAGDLFFLAHKSDVAKRDFCRIVCTLESS